MNYVAIMHYYERRDKNFYNVKITYNELMNIRDRIIRMRHNVINERGLLSVAFEFPFFGITENIAEYVLLTEEIYFYREDNDPEEFDFIVELFK